VQEVTAAVFDQWLFLKGQSHFIFRERQARDIVTDDIRLDKKNILEIP